MIDQIEQIQKLIQEDIKKKEEKKPPIKWPLKIEIDWSTADMEALQDYKERHYFSIASPIKSNVTYGHRLSK